jgi:N-dimethylarginine dimethylaminohydrolase
MPLCGAWRAPCGVEPRMLPIEPGTYLFGATSCATNAHNATTACTYQVQWTINPHMKPGAVQFDVARAQHDAFVSAIATLGGRVAVLPFVCGAFDSVFIKDNAILRHDGRPRALVADPAHAVREVEQAARAEALRALGFELAEACYALEGGDVIQVPGVTLLGCGPRSSPRAAACLERFLGGEVVSLPLRDPRLYHLDTAMAVLDDRTALICREAFTSEARVRIEQLVARGVLRAAYAVPYREALGFATNIVEVNGTIVTGARAPTTRAILEGLGRTVVEVVLDQFHLAGGSAACLVARAMQMPTTAIRSAAA